MLCQLRGHQQTQRTELELLATLRAALLGSQDKGARVPVTCQASSVTKLRYIAIPNLPTNAFCHLVSILQMLHIFTFLLKQ